MSKERQNISARAILTRVVPVLALAASSCAPRFVRGQETPSPTEPISAEYTPTPIPSTPTPEIEATATQVRELPEEPFRLKDRQPQEFVNGAWQEVALPEIPESLKSTVMLGENGLLQVKVQLTNFEAPDGLVIGEYKDREWHPVPFSFTRPLEVIRESLVLNGPDYWPSVEEYQKNPYGVETLAYGGPFLGMRLEADEETGETRLEILMVQRFEQLYQEEEESGGLRIVKISPSRLNLYGAESFSPTYGRTYEYQEQHDPRSLSLETIAKIIELAEMKIPLEEESFISFTPFIITDEVTEDTCRGYQAYGPGFNKYCLEMIGNKDRPIKNAADFKKVIMEHTLSPSEQMLANGTNWWDDNLLPALSGDNFWMLARFYTP